MGSVIPGTHHNKFISPTLFGTTSLIGDKVIKVEAGLKGLADEMRLFRMFVEDLLRTHDPIDASARTDEIRDVLNLAGDGSGEADLA